MAFSIAGVLSTGHPFRRLTIGVLSGAEPRYILVNIFIELRLRWTVHNATLRLSVEITTSVLAALALLALTFFSQLTIPLKPSYARQSFAKPHQAVLSSSSS